MEPKISYSLVEEIINSFFPSYPRDPYLEVRRTVDDDLIARVYKRYYSPWPVGWSADGTGLYFQMKRGQPPEWPVHVLWLPDKTVQAAREAMDEQSTRPLPRRSISYRPAASTNVEAGWYIDDVLVEDAGSAPQTNISDYTVFGLNSIWLRKGSDLYSGNIGALNASEGPVLNREPALSLARLRAGEGY